MVVFLLPFLLIIPALVARLRYKRPILAAVLVLPVLAFGIYMAITTAEIASSANQGASTSTGVG